jgi:heme-degrading monooxygenase HmoA
MLVSVTRIRVRSVKFIPTFMWMNFLTARQIVRSPGFSGGRLLIDANRTFWTLTAWETEQNMKAFRGSGAHVRAMPRLLEWCDESSYAHWTTTDAVVPAWPEAYEHLVNEGRLSRVNHPSPNQIARQFMKPRLRPLIGMDLKPSA